MKTKTTRKPKAPVAVAFVDPEPWEPRSLLARQVVNSFRHDLTLLERELEFDWHSVVNELLKPAAECNPEDLSTFQTIMTSSRWLRNFFHEILREFRDAESPKGSTNDEGGPSPIFALNALLPHLAAELAMRRVFPRYKTPCCHGQQSEEASAAS